MKKDFREKLLHDFPILFREKNFNIRFEESLLKTYCGNGWFELIYELSSKLEKYIDTLNNICICDHQFHLHNEENNSCLSITNFEQCQCKKYTDRRPRAYCIKEKFGGLRFYVEKSDKQTNDLVKQAELKSYSICEICGNKGNPFTICDSWIFTFCEKCHNDYLNRIKK
jgi:hypothetical protein